MMSYWERLLSSAAPATTSWPPGFEAATVPPVLPRRVFNKSRVIATSSSAGSLQTDRKKRRPSFLGGGFSTAGLSSPASNNCPWGEDSPATSSGCWQELDGGLNQLGRRGSCAESPRDDDNDEHADGAATTSEKNVVGWPHRRRRRSSQRPSHEDMAEWQDGRPRRFSAQGVGLAAATNNSQQQQRRQQQQQRQKTQEASGGCISSEGRESTLLARVNDGATDTTAAANTPIVSGQAATAAAAAAPAASEAGSASISMEHAPGIFATYPITAPPPFPESKHVDPIAATEGPAGETTPTPSLSSLDTLDQHKDDIHSRFPEVQPQQEQRCPRGQGMGTELLNQAGVAAAKATGQAGGGQKVFHNFVFRRNNKRRSKDANGGLVSSSSCSSLEKRSSVAADESYTLGSRDENAAGGSLSAAGNREGRRGMGRSGGSGGRSVDARSSPWRRQPRWQSPPSMKRDRPRHNGEKKRVSSPPRTANDALSVTSFCSTKHNRCTGGAGGNGGGGGGGGHCSGGKRPLKCQRCGSERVRLFTTVASAKLSQGYLQPLPTAGPGGDVSRGRGGGRGSNTGGCSAACQLSSASFSTKRISSNNGVVTPVSSADHTRISGWGDNGRPLPTRPKSLWDSDPEGGRGGRIKIDLNCDAVLTGRKAPLTPPLRR